MEQISLSIIYYIVHYNAFLIDKGFTSIPKRGLWNFLLADRDTYATYKAGALNVTRYYGICLTSH